MARRRTKNKCITAGGGGGGGGVRKTGETLSEADIFRTLVSAIQSPQGGKQGVMKRVYSLLLILSKKASVSGAPCGGSSPEVVCDLAGVLFGVLEASFKELVSALLDATVRGVSVRPVIGELALVLRCCMLVFDLLGCNKRVQFEKGCVLLGVLRSLVPVELCGGDGSVAVKFRKFESEKTAVDEELATSKSLVEISGPWYLYLIPLLEVIADELLMNKSMREKLMLFDSVSSGTEMLFKRQFCHNNIGCVLEVITSQVILSCSLHTESESSRNRVILHERMDFTVPELSLQSALALLLNPIIVSAPKVLQSYLILLATKSICTYLSPDNVMPDANIADCFLLALETSVGLFSRCMHGLHVKICDFGNDSVWKPRLKGCFQQSFESFLHPGSREILLYLISVSKRSWTGSSNDMAFRSTPQLMAASVEYLKKNLCVFSNLYKDDIQQILSWLISHISSDAVTDIIMLGKRETLLEDFVLLACIWKLMSYSMLLVLRFGSHLKLSDGYKCADNVASYKESMVYFHGCFEQVDMNVAFKRFASQVMESTSPRHNECKSLLLYFSSLLSITYPSQVDFLVKDCLYIMTMLCHMFINEEGNLSELLSWFSSKMGCFSSNSSNGLTMVSVVQEATSIVTRNARKVHCMYMRYRSLICSNQANHDNQKEQNKALAVLDEQPVSATAHRVEETCKGDAFLKCIIGKHAKKLPDFDDLADFIECERGKDYCAWLKAQDKFRHWKQMKREKRRWYRKKMGWKSVSQHRPCLKFQPLPCLKKKGRL